MEVREADVTRTKALRATSSSAAPAARARTRDRERTLSELRRAIQQVKERGDKLSISAVAREAGVVPSLIHNTYPQIAKDIRAQLGRSSRSQRDQRSAELVEARKTIRELRDQLRTAEHDIAKLASVNKGLKEEVTRLSAESTSKVVVLPRR